MRKSEKAELPGDRLKKLRQADRRHLTAAADAARAMDVPEPTYQGHENNSRGLTGESLVKYAKFYDTTVDYILTGRSNAKKHRVPVVGFIGEAQEFTPVNLKNGEKLELIDPPPGEGGPFVAARIRGNDMFPLRDGWIIFWNEHEDGVPETAIGLLSVVTLKDGRRLVKDVHRGTEPGRYNLFSWNAPMMPDVEVAAAFPVVDIRPTRPNQPAI